MIRRALRILLGLVVAGALILGALGLWLHLGGARWALNRVLQRINPYPGTSLVAGSVGGSLLRGAEVGNLEFRTGPAEIPARIERITLRYTIGGLLGDETTIDEIRIAGATVRLKRRPDGSWELPEKPAPRAGEKTGAPPRIRIRRILLQDVTATAGDIRLADVTLRAHDLAIADGVSVAVDTVTFRFGPPDPSPALAVAGSGSLQGQRLTIRSLRVASASSSVAVRGTALISSEGIRGVRDIDLTAVAPRLSLRDLRGLGGQFDRDGELTLDLRAKGSAENLSYRLAAALDDEGGTLEAAGSAPLPGAGPGSYSIEARVRHLNVARLTGWEKPLEPVDAKVRAKLSGKSLTHLDGDVWLELRGPAAATLDARFVDGEADLGLSGEFKASRADFRGKVRPFDSLPRYRLQGTLRLPPRLAKGRLSPLRLRIDGRGGSANVRSELELAGARVNADGSVVLGSPVRFAITRGTLAGVGISEGDSLNAKFTLRGTGVKPSTMSVRGWMDLLSSTIAGRWIDSLRTDLTLRRGSLDLRARGMVEGSAVSLEADARPFEGSPALRVRRLEADQVELQRLLPQLGLTTHADVVASGTLVGGLATIETDVRDPGGRLTLAATARPLDPVPSLELREARLEDVNLARVLDDPKFETKLSGRLTGRARGTGMQDISATAALDLAGSEVRGRVLRNARADFALDRGRLRLLASAAADGDSLQITGTLDTSRAVLHTSGSVRGARVDSAGAVLSLGEGRRRVDTLWVQSNFGRISGSGTPTNLRLAGQLTDISPLRPLLGLDSLATDSLSFTAALGRPEDSLGLNVTARALDLTVDENRFGEVNVRFAGRMDSTRRAIASGTGTLALQQFTRGNTAVASAALQAVYDSREVGITADAVVDRDRGARVVGKWVPAESTRILLDSVDIRTAIGQWGLVHPVEVRYGERLSIDDLVLASGTQRIAVNGVVDRRGEQSLHARLDSVRFGPFAELVGLRNLDGMVAGGLDLEGPAASPRAVGEVSIRFLAGAKRMGRARGSAEWDSLGLNLDLALTPSKGDSLTVKGVVPLRLSLKPDTVHSLIRPVNAGRLDVNASARAFRLETLEPLLNPSDIDGLKGLLSMDIAFRGTAEEPVTSGSIRVRDLKVKAPKLGASYKGTAAATLSGRELSLTSAKLRTGGGDAEATGTFRLLDSAGVGLDLDAAFSDFQVAEAKDFGSKLSGRVHLGGSSAAPEVNGKVTTQNAYFYLTSESSSGAVADVELTPEELETVERRFGSLARKKEKLDLFEASSLDLNVTLGPNNWIRRRSDPVVSVELDGAVDIRKEPRGKLNVHGDVKALTGRSFVETVGRRFELTEGGAKLSGPLETAELDLEAEYRVASQGQSSDADVTITAEVTADTGSIAITLGSRPSMEQRDIMSYLLTGAPATTDPTLQSSSGQNYLSTGASLAVGAALGTIAGSAGQELGFDVVQILQDMQGAQTLVAGKYVSPDLYIGFRQPLSEATSDDKDPKNVSNVMEFEVEYAAFRKALLNLQGAGSEFRVFLRLRGGK